MLKTCLKLLAMLSLVSLAACGPGQPPANDQNAPPPADANTAPTSAPAQAEPSASDEEAAKVRAEQRKLEAIKREEARARNEPPPRPACQDCGVIAGIQEERIAGDATAIGTLGGAAAGGLAGGQFGKKSGKIALIALGAIGGAFAGREVESQVRARIVYHVTVNMEAGGSQEITVDSLNGLGVGSKVHVYGNTLQYAE